MTPEDLAPGFVPERFSRRRAHAGENVRSLSGGGAAGTVVLFFDKAEPHSPVEVAASPDPAAQLAGTEERPGVKVDLDVPGVEAVYHDGQWAPGPGPGQISNGEVTLHWSTKGAHSITARVGGESVTVRAPKSVDLDGLLEIARSVPAIARR